MILKLDQIVFNGLNKALRNGNSIENLFDKNLMVTNIKDIKGNIIQSNSNIITMKSLIISSLDYLNKFDYYGFEEVMEYMELNLSKLSFLKNDYIDNWLKIENNTLEVKYLNENFVYSAFSNKNNQVIISKGDSFKVAYSSLNLKLSKI